MEDNNVVATKNDKPVKEKTSFGAKIKEWGRKQLVNLKRKPQNIAFFLLIITTIYNLILLGTYSQASSYASKVDWVGLMVFVNTLFSILVVVCFLNCFPKMKKYKSKTTITVNFTKASKININLVMLVVYSIFIIAMIVCEVIYHNLMSDFLTGNYYLEGQTMTDELTTQATTVSATLTYSIVHIVLLAIDLVLTYLSPVFGKLLVKVNTSKELESAVSNMQEIDLASEE